MAKSRFTAEKVEIHLDTCAERRRAFVFFVKPIGYSGRWHYDRWGFIPGQNVSSGRNYWPQPVMHSDNYRFATNVRCAAPLIGAQLQQPLPMQRTTRSAVLVLSLASVVDASSLKTRHAQTPVSGTFITMLGKDTLAIEQYTRTEAGLVGDYVTREGRSVVNHYTVHFTPDGNPGHVILAQTYADGSAIPGYPKRVQLTIGPTESVIQIDRDSIVTRKFEMSKTLPLLGTSLGMLELAFARLRAQKVDSGAFPGLPLNSRIQPDPIPVRFFATDSARVWTTDGAMYLRVDSVGKILGLSGRATTHPLEARRIATVDMTKLLARFAATEATGKAEKQE